ncbi:MAG TPA: c-type cytochrome [Tepidisphaeraceae bacterium]|jgi:putative heme-binding domain-containing protein|nr:c-type cytochrome [Tepidisphaeraceae bacterium]
MGWRASGWITSLLFVLSATAAPPTTQPLPVHLLVPGFVVRELPVQITNLNNLEYAPDGRLFAVGYDGRVHVLTDTDGDGLEETAKVYWGGKPGEIRAPVGICIRPEGIYIASKGRISLVKDTNHDGVADECEMVVGGWKELFVAVDSLGVAVDKDGSLYYGRGCFDFTNPMQIDKKTGVAGWNRQQETGTIMKVSPDRKTREIVCTGIRFSVGLQFNRDGDLFCTDQEGATWCPNGNPVDELLQIVPGRHYGFPPQYLHKLPGVNDEPNVVSFGPQHQSTCGMKFNEETKDRKSFGPAFWEGDALVVGESRGKIWRCPLVKTSAGYIGKPVVIATQDMLTIDCAISPKGDLLICCHSGPPDWGTGPKGPGRIFKISYADRAAPQPVAVWPAGPGEIRVAFDKPVDEAILSESKTLIGGEYVRAADRQESMTPPYVVVTEQRHTPIANIRVSAQSLSKDRRMLSLSTDPMPWRSYYSLAVPGVRKVGEKILSSTVDLDFMPTGVEARFQTTGAQPEAPAIWLPHLDSNVNQRWTRNSSEHERWYQELNQKAGILSLRTALDLPGKEATLKIESNQAFNVSAGTQQEKSRTDGKTFAALFTVGMAGAPVPIELAFTKAAEQPLELNVSYHTDIDAIERPIPTERLVLPWAAALPLAPRNGLAPKPTGGDWARGKSLFFGEAQCSTCHTLGNQGGNLGPNLSNLTHKDPDSVMRDIIAPSTAINPDFINYRVKLKNGDVLAGLVGAEGDDRLTITEGVGKTTLVKRGDVSALSPSDISIMPDGYKDQLGPEKLKDLITFLTEEPPKKK